MLATGNHTLTFKSEHGDDSHKHCVLVKLTDSSVKVIEEYLKNRDHIGKKPTIMFQRDRGEISFPTKYNGGSDPGGGPQNKKFFFALSSVKESNKDTSASFECISYAESKLRTIGMIEQRLTVQANEDVFLATKERVNTVEEEAKKNSTRELAHPAHRKAPNPAGLIRRPGNPAAVIVSKSSNVENLNSKPRVIDRSIRERIVHLLALQPYAKAELMLRLFKDNPLNEKEKDSLDVILQEVCIFNQRTNQFELTNEVMLSEVKEDWEFFSNTQKQYLKRNLAKAKQNQSAGLPTSFSSHQSSASSLQPPVPPVRPSPTFSAKPASSAFVSIPKQASSAASSDDSRSEASITAFIKKNNSPVSRSEPLRPGSTNQHEAGVRKSPASLKRPEPRSVSPEPAEVADLKRHEHVEPPQANKKLKENGHDQPHSHSAVVRSDIEREYRPIQSRAQMERYSGEFSRLYPQYEELRGYMEGLAKQSATQKAELEQIGDRSSPEYREKSSEIVQGYMRLQQDRNHVAKQDRYKYLELKLGRIYELIRQYEESALSSSAASSTSGSS